MCRPRRLDTPPPLSEATLRRLAPFVNGTFRNPGDAKLATGSYALLSALWREHRGVFAQAARNGRNVSIPGDLARG